MAPKFATGDIVEIVASGVQGKIVRVDAERDLYVVDARSYIGTYPRTQLKGVPGLSVQPRRTVVKIVTGEGREYLHTVSAETINVALLKALCVALEGEELHSVSFWERDA